MRILWLNWRETRNPDSGGAQVLTHEIANRLVKKGHKVTLFGASFEGSNKHKLPDHSILAFKKIKEQLPNSQMNVIGGGYWLEKLKQMKVKDVTFHGHISNKDKYDILSLIWYWFQQLERDGNW